VSDNPYRGHRFPREIISYAVWFYYRFAVSFREVEEAMAGRGVLVSYETVRRWCDKFGKQYADGLRKRRARTGDKWHLDEVFLKINGVTHYLWRAVDQNGVVLDILVQPKRDRFAAIRFFRKLLRVTGRKPRVIITDKLRSYGAAKRVVMPGVAHRQHRYLNNRAENSHQPTRERERRMRRFKSRAMRSGSLRYTESLPRISALDATCSPLLITANSAANDSASGMKSVGRPLSPDPSRVKSAASRYKSVRGPVHSLT
jgi:putative transposase